jgi:hypothetical protein
MKHLERQLEKTVARAAENATRLDNITIALVAQGHAAINDAHGESGIKGWGVAEAAVQTAIELIAKHFPASTPNGAAADKVAIAKHLEAPQMQQFVIDAAVKGYAEMWNRLRRKAEEKAKREGNYQEGMADTMARLDPRVRPDR